MQHDDHNRDHFDLLPFIAILLCMLGCLLLVTLSVAAISLGAGAGEGWIPSPDPNAKNAILVEWDGATLVVHRPAGHETIKWSAPVKTQSGDRTYYVAPDEGDVDPAYRKFLTELQTAKSRDYALFAVRPSGFDQFEFMASNFREMGIDIGSEPLAEGKSVKLLPRPTTTTNP